MNFAECRNVADVAAAALRMRVAPDRELRREHELNGCCRNFLCAVHAARLSMVLQTVNFAVCKN